VLSGYGTGAVMAVPAHDERDYAFAQNFNLPIKRVVAASTQEEDALPMVEEGVLVNSADFNGMSSAQAKSAIVDKLAEKFLGEKKVSYRLRDWVFSRQRYWGEPIPIYFLVEFSDKNEKDPNPITGSNHRICYEEPIAVDEADLPLKLPEMKDFQVGGRSAIQSTS
jgi:leucyl-tRNA synthetase